MLELHGWITLRESYKANDEEKNMKHIFGNLLFYRTGRTPPSSRRAFRYHKPHGSDCRDQPLYA